MRAVHVHAGRSGKVEHNELGRYGFSAHPIQNRVSHMIHVEIDKTRLRPEDQHAGNQLIVWMPLAIGKAPRAGNAPENGDMRSGRATDQ